MDGIVHTYEARLIAKGYTQLYVVDYEETFSPVAYIRAIRILIAIATFYDYEIWIMDVKTAFLNGYLDEDIYMVLSQSAYMDKILKRYRMDNSKRGNIPMQEILDLDKTQSASTPEEVKRMQNVLHASAVGSIIYAVRCTRPDVADSYVVPASPSSTTTIDTTSDESGKKSGRTVTLTAEDMQKNKNDATKKTKKNLLKQQYGNFKAEGSETLEQTFNRLQVIVGQLPFMDVEIKQDDLNQKFLTSLAPEWLMHTIVWRNRGDLDTMSLDDLYNHLKVYESEVQKKSDPNSQNMAFISSAKHISRNEDGNTACVSTASTNVHTASASVATISQDTACTYIASQSSGSQIKFKDINQIDEDDMEEMDIKWNMALLSMRANKFWKKTGNKISIQGSHVAGFDKSYVECFNCHKMGHFARECRAPRSQERRRRDNYRQGSKAKEQEFALMANTNAESKVFDNSLCSKDCKKNNDSLNSKITDQTDKLFDAKNLIYHYKLALAKVKSRLVEYKEREVKYYEKIRTLEFMNESNNECIEIVKKKLETLKEEKEGVDGKLAGLLTASKDLDNLIESQRSDKNKDGLGCNAVLPPPSQLYLSPKKDLSWTGLPEYADDTVTDYSRPSPTVESTSGNDQKRNPSVSKTVASPITPKPFIKFVKPKDNQTKSKIDENVTPKKSPVKYAEQYIKPNKKPNVRGNQRNWNNLKSQQLGPDFFMKKKACFNCGDFNHLVYDCRKRVKKSFTPKPVAHRPYRPPVDQNFPPVNRKFSTPSRNFLTANRKFPTASRKFLAGSTKCSIADMGIKGKAGISPNKIDDKGYWDSGCSRHMTGKQHKASCKSKVVNVVTKPLHTLHMDLFGPTSVSSISHKWYCLVVTDDFSRFTWTFFLKSKDETSGILKKFISEIENLKDLKVKIIRCDNRGEFRNKEMNDFCSQKMIKREFSNARTPQQNGVAKRRNRTLIEAAGTMLVDAKIPVTFWVEAINTACYVQNRVLVNKSHNKTPYELFNGRSPAKRFLKPFGCHVMILNTLDNLGKFEEKGDEVYFIGYSMSSKAFRVFNKRTKRVEENLHVQFLENKAIKKAASPNWLFDIDSLTKSMNYVSVDASTISTNISGTKDATSQEVESSSSKPQDHCSTKVPEGSGNLITDKSV
nr:retrovirus-related Pol polyprotein from transposon TNT 1-94 [Tanacetum cinerariifolium]